MGRPRMLSDVQAAENAIIGGRKRANAARASRVLAGICCHGGCSSKELVSATYCATHLEYQREYHRSRRRAEGKIVGQCRDCRTKTLRGGLLCEECAEKARVRSRTWTLLNTYGLSLAEYEEMLTSQNGRCAVCKDPLDIKGAKGKGPHVDHDHATGKVRGILCATCNMGIGTMGDSAERLRAAADYLDHIR